MGYLFQDTCYEVEAEAQASYHQQQESVWLIASNAVVIRDYWNGTAWRQQKIDYTGSGSKNTAWDVAGTVALFPSCTPSTPAGNFSDGVVLGWGVVLAMAIAWGFREMKRQAR